MGMANCIQVRLAVLLLLSVVRVRGSSCMVTSDIAICNNQGIAKVPQYLPKDITNLNLNRNKIQEINIRDLRRYPYLRKLFMSENQLTTLDEDVFLSLTELTEIDLSHNSITCVEKYIFTANMNLSSVNFYKNTLSLNGSSPIFISSSIKYLDLTSCGIRLISKVTFSEMYNLKFLNISENNILHLDLESFSKNSLKILCIDVTPEVNSSLATFCGSNIEVYHSAGVNYCSTTKNTSVDENLSALTVSDSSVAIGVACTIGIATVLGVSFFIRKHWMNRKTTNPN